MELGAYLFVILFCDLFLVKIVNFEALESKRGNFFIKFLPKSAKIFREQANLSNPNSFCISRKKTILFAAC